jgi:preprotein translocase subunit SecD
MGKMLAVLINGRVVSAGIIVGKFSNPVTISGEFTEEEAERIASGINRH